jgi:elongation factor Ts
LISLTLKTPFVNLNSMGACDVTFTAKDVMDLRQKTGLGMMDCKKALNEKAGDLAAAEEWLRETRKDKMSTRTERATAEGRIGIVVDGSQAVIVEVLTETDFTARNDKFVEMVEGVAQAAISQPAGDVAPDAAMTALIDDQRITTGENVNFGRGQKIEGGSFGSYLHHDGKRACLIQVEGDIDDSTLKGICQHIVFHDPMGIGPEDVPADKIEQIRTDAQAEAEATGKPAEIAQKMADGKVRKFLQECTLLAQKYVLDESKRVEDMLPDGAKIKAFVRYTLGG